MKRPREHVLSAALATCVTLVMPMTSHAANAPSVIRVMPVPKKGIHDD
jgi:hypothetical protein